jgi:hypothetical protein
MTPGLRKEVPVWRDPIMLVPLVAIVIAGAVLMNAWSVFSGPAPEPPTPTPQPSDPAAVGLLQQMEAAMNQLNTLKSVEVLEDDSGNTLTSTLLYAAPDRLILSTDTGSTSIGIGRQQWARSPGETLWTTWTRREAFVFPDFHYYSRQAVNVQLGAETSLDGQPVKSVTFDFTGFEGVYRFVVYGDASSLRFLQLTMDGPGHHMVTNFVDYSPTVTITAPSPGQIAPTPTVLVPQP